MCGVPIQDRFEILLCFSMNGGLGNNPALHARHFITRLCGRGSVELCVGAFAPSGVFGKRKTRASGARRNSARIAPIEQCAPATIARRPPRGAQRKTLAATCHAAQPWPLFARCCRQPLPTRISAPRQRCAPGAPQWLHVCKKDAGRAKPMLPRALLVFRLITSFVQCNCVALHRSDFVLCNDLNPTSLFIRFSQYLNIRTLAAQHLEVRTKLCFPILRARSALGAPRAACISTPGLMRKTHATRSIDRW